MATLRSSIPTTSQTWWPAAMAARRSLAGPGHHDGVVREQARPSSSSPLSQTGRVSIQIGVRHEHLGEHDSRPPGRGVRGEGGNPVDGRVTVHQRVAGLDGCHPEYGHRGHPGALDGDAGSAASSWRRKETAVRGVVSTVSRRTSLRL